MSRESVDSRPVCHLFLSQGKSPFSLDGYLSWMSLQCTANVRESWLSYCVAKGGASAC